jgi:hypothetical protein|nr:MAG TPA: RNA polymerase-like protein [Caudoviricetes sp.]
MKCPKCGSENVSVQVVTETELKEKKHGVIWWVCVGWWWIPIKWLVFTLPALIIAIFKPKKYKTKTHTKKMAVCNNCGKSWNV